MTYMRRWTEGVGRESGSKGGGKWELGCEKREKRGRELGCYEGEHVDIWRDIF